MPENELPGTSAWRITDQGPADAINGYASAQSVLPGQSFMLYVSTTAPSFRADAFRFGYYQGHDARLIWTSPPVRGRLQTAVIIAPGTHMVTAPWQPSLTVRTANWPIGSYLLRLDASDGPQRYVPITVRSPSTAGKVVILNDNTTWQAYNTWGGYSLYQGPDGLPSDRGYAVSFDRRYDGDGAVKFLAFEQAAIAVAERSGVPLAYETDVDIDQHPGLLDGARAVISLGHDEYYSQAVRSALLAARNAGTNLAFLGANAIYRHIRFAGTGAYKGESFPGMVGPEYDRLNPDVPFPRPIQVLAHSPLTCDGYSTFSDTAYYTVPSGAGVFASGTMRWVCAIRGPYCGHGLTWAAERFVVRATENLLRVFAAGPRREGASGAGQPRAGEVAVHPGLV